ncbi:glycosyltransferase family 32 protein [Clostridium perfringens]|uniref:glycosyltransferase family 32 protein n=1 Tax=Clostridium perfringens TaxID=1502 RepID=UPI0035148D0C
MIPKIIHYCWFGGKDKPEIVNEYINTWKKVFPDYEIREWNEENFHIEKSCKYVQEAYKAGKYAFVSDYVRLYALYEVGGLYFDTDIEAVENIDRYLKNKDAVFGFEDDHYVMTGFIAAKSHLDCFKKLIDIYNEKSFILSSGKYDTLPNTVIVTNILEDFGLIPNGKKQTFSDNFDIFPYEYFSAYNIAYQKLNITKDTKLIHHCMGTWQSPKDRIKPKIKSILLKIIGDKNFEILKERFYKKQKGI